MTNREFFVAIVNANLGDEMTEKAKEMISAIDMKNAKAQAKRVENAKANEPLLVATVEFLRENKVGLASDVAKALDVSTSKASALLKKLVDVGTIEVNDIKVPKVGTRKAYRLTVSEVGVVEE